MFSDINSKVMIKFYLPVILLFLLMGGISLYQGEAKYDEYWNHFPVLEGMKEVGYINYVLGENYDAANTPLPYLLPYFILNISPSFSTLITARIVNFIFAFLTIILFYLLIRKAGIKDNYVFLILLFYPYFIKTSFAFYLSLYGLFFLLSAVFLIRKQKIILSGLAGSAGVLSQQFLFAIPAAYLVKIFLDDKASWKKKINLKKIWFFIPFILPLLLFIYWGGITHSNWRFHGPTADLTHITAQLTILGGVFFPFVIDKVRVINRYDIIIAAVISVLLTGFFLPVWGGYGALEQVTGYTFNFLHQVKQISVHLFYFLHFVLCFTGVIMLSILIRSKKDDKDIFLLVTGLFFGLIYFFDAAFSERHMLPLIGLLLLLVLPRFENKLLLKLWTVYQVLFGSAYFYYWLFIHPSFS